MFRLLLFVLIAAFYNPLFAQEIDGTWKGATTEDGKQIPYTLYLKRMEGNLYFGVSESGLRKPAKKIVIGCFDDTSYYRRRIWDAGGLRLSELAPLNGSSRDFVGHAYSVAVTSGTMKSDDKKTTTVLNLQKTDAAIPSEYVALCPKEAFTTMYVVYNNSRNDDRIHPGDVGSLSLKLKHNLPFEEPLSAEIGLRFKNKYFQSAYDNTKHTLSHVPINLLFSEIEPEYGITEDIVDVDISIRFENRTAIHVPLKIPAVPFVREELIKASKPYQAIMNGYYGTNQSPWKPLRTVVDGLVKKNDSIAMCYQAILQHQGIGGYTRNEAAGIIKLNQLMEYIRQEAKKGDAEALYLLFYAMEIGKGGDEPSFITKLPGTYFFLDKSAEAGFLPAKYDRAALLLSHQDTAWYSSCVKDLLECYENGIQKAATLLGVAYEAGLGTTKDSFASIDWYRKAIAFGDPQAMYRMARLQLPDESGQTLMQRAADSGDNNAILYLASQYLSGSTNNIQQAIKLFQKSAYLGYAEGMEALAVLYKKQLNDDSLSRQWAIKGALAGSGLCMAMLSAIAMNNNDDNEKLEARLWYNQALERGAELQFTSDNFLSDVWLESVLGFAKKGKLYSHRNSSGHTTLKTGGDFNLEGFQADIFRFLTGGITITRTPHQAIRLIYKDNHREIYSAKLASEFSVDLGIHKEDLVIVKSYGAVRVDDDVTVNPGGTSRRYMGQKSDYHQFWHGAALVQFGNNVHPIFPKRYFTGEGNLLFFINDQNKDNNSGAFDLYIEVIRAEK